MTYMVRLVQPVSKFLLLFFVWVFVSACASILTGKGDLAQGESAGSYSSISFRVYNTPQGTADIVKGVLNSIHPAKVSYVRLYDGGYRFYYRSAECKTSLDCDEFTVSVKPGTAKQTQAGSKPVSHVSITGIDGSLNREVVRSVYYEIAKFSDVSLLFSLDDNKSILNRKVYEISFTADASPAVVISWMRNILLEMADGQKGINKGYLHVRKLGNVFYRLTYRDIQCEEKKKKYDGVKKLLKLGTTWCPGFIVDAGSRGGITVVEIYATDHYLPFPVVNALYLRLSDIVKTANYTEDF